MVVGGAPRPHRREILSVAIEVPLIGGPPVEEMMRPLLPVLEREHAVGVRDIVVADRPLAASERKR